jgi:hypothetical protein
MGVGPTAWVSVQAVSDAESSIGVNVAGVGKLSVRHADDARHRKYLRPFLDHQARGCICAGERPGVLGVLADDTIEELAGGDGRLVVRGCHRGLPAG